MKTKLKNAKGFTIIEVLIVLAIAGLILLIVFMAVPNLQRNNRNTQRNSAAAAVLGAFSEFSSNNNGTNATTFAVATGTLTVSGPAGTNPSTVGISGIFTSYPSPAARPATVVAPTADTLHIYTNAICNGNVHAAGTSARQVVAYYATEPGTRCVAS